MALLVDRETKQDLKNRIEEFSKYAVVLDYMLDINAIEKEDLEKMFFSKDIEISSITYFKIIKKIKDDIFNKAYEMYSNKISNDLDLDYNSYLEYLNNICLKDIISKLSNEEKIDKTYVNTYNHLLMK